MTFSSDAPAYAEFEGDVHSEVAEVSDALAMPLGWVIFVAAIGMLGMIGGALVPAAEMSFVGL